MKRVYLRTMMDKAWPGSWFFTQNHLGWHTIAQTMKQGAAYTYAKQCPKFTKKTVDRTCASSNTAQVEVQNGGGFAKLQGAWTKMLNRDQIYLGIANMEQTWHVQYVVVWGMWDFNSLNLWRWCIMGLVQGFTRDAAIACSFCAAAMEEVASPTNSIAFNKSHMTYTPQFSSLHI